MSALRASALNTGATSCAKVAAASPRREARTAVRFMRSLSKQAYPGCSELRTVKADRTERIESSSIFGMLKQSHSATLTLIWPNCAICFTRKSKGNSLRDYGSQRQLCQSSLSCNFEFPTSATRPSMLSCGARRSPGKILRWYSHYQRTPKVTGKTLVSKPWVNAR